MKLVLLLATLPAVLGAPTYRREPTFDVGHGFTSVERGLFDSSYPNAYTDGPAADLSNDVKATWTNLAKYTA
jgi:hypothetical protein